MADGNVRLKIDDREIETETGTSILNAAAKAGIDIPYLCYEKNLTTVGSCRVCLVEVEGNPKLQPACSTAVCEKMVVKTDSVPVREARRGVLELLLINHPLDCPVCDKGGECKLQDYVFRYGAGRGRFNFKKRTYGRDDIGPFVMRDMNRCVHCTRCVRFTSEISLSEDLGAFERGDKTSINTYLGHYFRNPFSGNVIELCPVGALTDRVFRFKARVWDLENVSSACPLCPVGCLTRLQMYEGRILRVLRREGGFSPWICDFGRFGYSQARTPKGRPTVLENGQRNEVPLETALQIVSEKLGAILRKSGPGRVGALCSPAMTNEEIFGIRRVFTNVLGSNNVDFRLRAAGPVSDEEASVLSQALRSQGRIEESRDCESIMFFCADPCEEAPIAGLEFVKAASMGRYVVSVGPRRSSPEILSKKWIASTPEDGILVLAAIAREAASRVSAAMARDLGLSSIVDDLGGFSLERVSRKAGIDLAALDSIVDEILSSRKLGLVVGREVFHSRSIYVALSAALRICAIRHAVKAGETVFLSLLGEANVRGALELGAFPAALGELAPAGMCFDEMIEASKGGGIKALFVFGCDPLLEYENRSILQEALENLKLLVVQNSTPNETARLADVYLPLQSIFEREGSFISFDGNLRAVSPETSALGTRSLLFNTLQAVSNATGRSFDPADSDSLFQEIKLARGWVFEGDLKALARSAGVRLPSPARMESRTWLPAREFEKVKAKQTTIEEGRRVTEPEDDVSEAEDYPFVLLTGIPGVSTWTWAREVSEHQSVPKSCFAEISDADAEELGISAGEEIRVDSRAGSIRAVARPTSALMRGVVFVPQGFSDAAANVLTGAQETVVRVRVRKTGV